MPSREKGKKSAQRKRHLRRFKEGKKAWNMAYFVFYCCNRILDAGQFIKKRDFFSPVLEAMVVE